MLTARDHKEQGVVCEGFQKLYERLSKQLKQSDFFDKESYQLQLSSMKNQWALWLDQFSRQIQLVKSVDKRELAKHFGEFAARLEDDVLAGNYGFIREPLERLKMGQIYRKKEDWAQAFKAYSNGTATKSMAYGIYYQAACQINRDYSKGLEAKKEFKKYLYSVKESIAYESSQLAIGNQVVSFAQEYYQKQGHKVYQNEYKKQVEEKLQLWGYFDQSISQANRLVDLEENFYCLEEDCLVTQNNWIKLCKTKIFIKEEIINRWFDQLQCEQSEDTFSSSTSILNTVSNTVSKVFKRTNPEADKVQLEERFELMDLDLAKDKKHAAKQLWDYLLSKEVIKLPRLNIGLKLGSKAVKERLEDLKGTVEDYLNKNDRLKELLKNNNKEEREKALDTIYGQLIGYIGSLHQLVDDRVKATFFDIKQTYFIDQQKVVPQALYEFEHWGFESLFSLEERKDPPKWWEVFAVIGLEIAQIALGVLAKMFLPGIVHFVGEFLINMGSDDNMFGIQAAISGEFSWRAYGCHKKQSAISSAITAVVFSSVQSLKQLKKTRGI